MSSIGIDLGGTKVLGVLLGADGRALAEARMATPGGPVALIDAVSALACQLRDAQLRDGLGTTVVGEDGQLAGLGVGVPGLVGSGGVLRFAANLPGVRDLDVATLARRDLGAGWDGVPLRVDNDANCAGWGERAYGAAKGSDNALVVTIGTGIGGGVVTEGRLLSGANGFGGELGHMVIDPHGPPCPCGKQGCWERLASGSGLGRLGREAALGGRAPAVVELAGGDPEAVRGEHVTAAASSGDAAAKVVMADYAWWVALGLTNLAAAFDPEVIVIGGGLAEAGPVLFDPLRDAFKSLLYAGSHRPEVPIVPATLGERAGAIGAAVLAREPGA
ncbi:MAG: ROK family protein [Acidimicrobiales bacterium]